MGKIKRSVVQANFDKLVNETPMRRAAASSRAPTHFSGGPGVPLHPVDPPPYERKSFVPDPAKRIDPSPEPTYGAIPRLLTMKEIEFLHRADTESVDVSCTATPRLVHAAKAHGASWRTAERLERYGLVEKLLSDFGRVIAGFTLTAEGRRHLRAYRCPGCKLLSNDAGGGRKGAPFDDTDPLCGACADKVAAGEVLP